MFMSRSRLSSNKSPSRRFRDRRLVLEPLERRVVMTAGMLDPSFGGGDGIVTHDMGPGENRTGGIVWDGDKIVVGGYAQGATTTTGTGKHAITTTDPRDMSIRRFNADGSLDNTFSGDGKASVSFEANKSDYGYDTAVTDEGKYVMVGSTTITHTVTTGKKATTATQNVMAMARFNHDGTLDASFSGDGKQTFSFEGTTDSQSAAAVVVQADGKIVVAGRHITSTFSRYEFGLTRLNVDGSVDTSFGTNGRVLTYLSGGYGGDDVSDLALQTVNDETFIVVSGRAGGAAASKAVLIRYRLDGSLDTTFGVGGSVLADFGTSRNGESSNNFAGIRIDPNSGAILTRTMVPDQYNAWDIGVAKYSSNGVLDNSFGMNGVAIVPLPETQSTASVRLQPDGKIVVAGFTITGAMPSVVARFTVDGQLDSSFGNNGVTEIAMRVSGTLLQPDGSIVVLSAYAPAPAGSSSTHWAIMRLTGDDIVEPSLEPESDDYYLDLAVLAMTDDDSSDE